MTIFTRYASRNGCILDTIDIPDTAEAYDIHSTLLVEGSYPADEYYVLAGEVTPRPDQGITVVNPTFNITQEEFCVIDGIILGSQVLIIGDNGYSSAFIADNTQIHFTTDVAGTYEFTFRTFPYRDTTISVTAVQD